MSIKYKISDPPKGMTYNPDKNIVNMITEGLIKTGGYCPCVPKHLHNSITKYPCLDSRVENNCKCKIFVKI